MNKEDYRKNLKGKTIKELKDLVTDLKFPKILKKELEEHLILELKKLGSTHRKFILKRDNYKCRICGDNILTTGEVHHITPKEFGGDNSVFNLVSLCPPCHMFMHCNPKLLMRQKRKLKKIQEDSGVKRGRPLGAKDKKQRSNRNYFKK